MFSAFSGTDIKQCHSSFLFGDLKISHFTPQAFEIVVVGCLLLMMVTHALEPCPFIPSEKIIVIYRKRWEIELLFKQLKQNFPLRYFYGESANAIKIQIRVTLIANLLLMIIQKRIKRSWSFSGLATMVGIILKYYVNCYTFLEEPEKDWAKMLEEAKEGPPEPSLFD